MEGSVKGDVVILEFPFSNLTYFKRRPSLVIKVPKGEDIIVCQITASSQEPSVEIIITENDFKQGNLRTNSFVRMDKIFSVEKSLIKYKAGSLKHEKFNEILDKVCNFLRE